MPEDRPIVALLTDFGVEDAYVGVMKSVIAGRCATTILDISHAVQPQNIAQAAYLLWSAYKYLPERAVTVGIVDPGVGTSRKAVAVRWPRGHFVGPDNGWMSYVIRDFRAQESGAAAGELPRGWEGVELTEPRFWLDPVSDTFHGRDIFAPVAAALVNGTSLSELGSPLASLTLLEIPPPTGGDGSVRGHVIHVDHFGNLITDVPAGFLPERYAVAIGSGTVEGPARSYESPDPLVALVGSSGSLEIAAPGGSAARLIRAAVGDPVSVTSAKKSGGTPTHE
jgi:S-adenosylmethionine hydrolase